MKNCCLLIFTVTMIACTPEKKEASLKGLNLPEASETSLLTVDFNGLEPFFKQS